MEDGNDGEGHETNVELRIENLEFEFEFQFFGRHIILIYIS